MRSSRPNYPALLAALLVAPFVLVTGAAAVELTAAAADSVDFASDIWPVLERSCLDCHGGKDTFSNLLVTSPEALLKGGDLGKVIVPGKPDESPLLTRTELPMDDLGLHACRG